jgi:hypothetical protein
VPADAPDPATVDGNGRDDAWYVNAEREVKLANARRNRALIHSSLLVMRSGHLCLHGLLLQCVTRVVLLVLLHLETTMRI